MAKIQRQERCSIMNPPRIGPAAGPMIVPNIGIRATPMRSSGGKVRKSSAIPTGVGSPPPAPCMTRKRTSWSRLCAAPQSADADHKDRQGREQDLAVAEAMSQPTRGRDKTTRLTKYPTMTDSIAAESTPNSWPSVGKATLTTVESSEIMTIAQIWTTESREVLFTMVEKCEVRGEYDA